MIRQHYLKIHAQGKTGGRLPNPPLALRVSSTEKGAYTRNLILDRIRAPGAKPGVLLSKAHWTAFCGQPRANEQEAGNSFYGPVGRAVELIGKGHTWT